MLGKLARLFEGLSESNPGQADETQLTRLAATALMIEMCRADHNVDEREIQQVLSSYLYQATGTMTISIRFSSRIWWSISPIISLLKATRSSCRIALTIGTSFPYFSWSYLSFMSNRNIG